jgi:hypothetical protein
MKRVLTLLLVLALVFSFVAFTKSEQEPKGSETTKVTTGTTKGAGNTTAGTTTAEVEENPFEEFFEITWLTQLNADWRDGRWDELELEEMFNVDLQVWPEDGRNTERMAALIAAGDIPDYFFAPVGWRDFLVFINDMLSKGYMTYLVNSGGADFHYNFYAHFNQGAFGHFPLDVYANMNPANIERINNWFPNGLLENDPEATFLIVPRLVGPDGKGGNKRYVNVPFRDGATGTWTFGAGCDDEKLERCMALLRYTHFTDEAFYRYFYGIENVHYKWSGEPYNSAIIATEYSKIPKKYTAGASTQKIFATDKFLMDFKKWSMLSEFFYQICNYQIEHEWFIKYTIEPDKLVHRLYMGDEKYDEFIKLRQEINSDILTVANDFRNKAFKGELADINAEWSYYIEALYRAGLEQYVEYFNDESFGLYEIEKESLYE